MRCCRNTSDSGKMVYNRIAPRAAAWRICSARADDSRERGEKPALCCGFLSRPKPLTGRGKWDMLAIAETSGYVPESPAPSVKPRSPQRGAPGRDTRNDGLTSWAAPFGRRASGEEADGTGARSGPETAGLSIADSTSPSAESGRTREAQHENDRRSDPRKRFCRVFPSRRKIPDPAGEQQRVPLPQLVAHRSQSGLPVPCLL